MESNLLVSSFVELVLTPLPYIVHIPWHSRPHSMGCVSVWSLASPCQSEADIHCVLEWMDLNQALLWAVHWVRRWEEGTQPRPLPKGKGPGPIGTAQREQTPAWSPGRWMLAVGRLWQDRRGDVMRQKRAPGPSWRRQDMIRLLGGSRGSVGKWTCGSGCQG